MWFSPTAVKVILTALASLVLLAVAGEAQGPLAVAAALAAPALPFLVWWRHVKQKS